MITNIKVGDFVQQYSGNGFAHSPNDFFQVVEVGSTRAKASVVPNLPDGEYYAGRSAPRIITFTIPRGKVVAKYSSAWVSLIDDIAEARDSNAEWVIASNEKAKTAEGKWQKKLARAKELNPQIDLIETGIPDVYFSIFDTDNNNINAVTVYVRHEKDRIALSPEYQYVVSFSGVHHNDFDTSNFSSGSVHGETLEDAIYEWIAGRM